MQDMYSIKGVLYIDDLPYDPAKIDVDWFNAVNERVTLRLVYNVNAPVVNDTKYNEITIDGNSVADFWTLRNWITDNIIAMGMNGGSGGGSSSVERPTTVPAAITAHICKAVTSTVDGLSFVAFSSYDCNALDIVNNTDTQIEYKRAGQATTDYMSILPGQARLVVGIVNSNEISIRRSDNSEVATSIYGEAIKTTNNLDVSTY